MITKTTDPTLDLLTQIGLPAKEALLYLLLLESGQVPVSNLINRSKLKKGNVYSLLNSLKLKDLVIETKKDKIRHFKAAPPSQLATVLRIKQLQLQETQLSFENTLPHLLQTFQSHHDRPIVQYFEGEDGVRQAFQDVYAHGKNEILGCVDLNNANAHLFDYIIFKLAPQRVKNGIHTRTLNSQNPRALELQKTDTKLLRQRFLVDPQKYSFPAEIDVYADKVAFMSFTKDNFHGVVIQNRDFATSLNSVFRLVFDLLSKPVPSSSKSP
jgi:sugar-specific transcriptional regulator TrmB